MNTSTSSITPAQIRRAMNDYDSQIRQALDEGSIRPVMKSLGDKLVSNLFFSATFNANTITGYIICVSEGNARATSSVPFPLVLVQIHSGLERPHDQTSLRFR
jgi:hypothetical protein